MIKAFTPGEVAVLPTDIGGRLFICGETYETDGGTQRVREAQSEWGRQNKQPPDTMGQHIDGLVKVKTRDNAVALVAVLKYIHAERQVKKHAADREAASAFKAAIFQHEAYEAQE